MSALEVLHIYALDKFTTYLLKQKRRVLAWGMEKGNGKLKERKRLRHECLQV